MISKSLLAPIARPRSIAFFGASKHFTAMGFSILSSILAEGFEGKIYPVHPKEKKVLGLDAFAHVESIPEVPDLAFIVLPTAIVAQTLEAFGKKGIRHAVIVTAGFSETGEAGKERQAELDRIANTYNIRYTGPNCIGVVNSHARLNATFIPARGRKGFIGMASQSGSFITQMFDYLDTRYGQGFSTGFSLGNEANIDLVDCLEYLGACPETRVIALYIESIRRGRLFIDTARKVAVSKPIVAYYAGGSESGKRACLSHTGSLSGPDRLYDGVFRQGGIIRAHSIEALFDLSYVLGSSALPKGRQVVIQTHSGGPGAAASDACDRCGLELPPLSESTCKKLAEFVPHTGSMNNLVDLTFTKNPLDFFHRIPKVLLEDEKIHGMLIYFLASAAMVHQALSAMGVAKKEIEGQTDKIIDDQCRAVAALMKESGNPFWVFPF